MASLGDKIIDYLAKHPNSKAREIADALQFTRKSINQTLYFELVPKGVVSKSWNDKWDLSKSAKESKEEAATRSRQGDIEVGDDHARALDLIEQGKNVFITGKAGTGKTTLLRMLQNKYKGKKVVITLAPTGVAAENAGGYTMHSFLRLPLVPYAPKFKTNRLFSLDDSSADVVRNLDIIVIDEISMVRCDMLDAADSILRHYRGNNLPFGGIQLVMFGDLFQLMPVVKPYDWSMIKEFYDTPYFFSSSALSKMPYYVCELTKVYRQKDDAFVNSLNNIRTGNISLSDIELINTRYVPASATASTKNSVTLMTRNWKTKKYNQGKLNELCGEERSFFADIVNWHEKPPTEKILNLKVGARVMFVKNDNYFHRYVNGTMGWVESFDDDAVYVREDRGNELIMVQTQRWDEFRFVFDKKTKTIYTEVVGSFVQIPLKLAWAVTVHKSQGLTFEEVDIDAADSFTYGQIYVALSRCKTLNGIRLLEKIPTHKVIADKKVMTYLSHIGKDGKVLPLPTFRVDLNDFDRGSGDYLSLSIRRGTFDLIGTGKVNRLVRNIKEKEALELFESSNGSLLPNSLFCGIDKRWKYNDMNNGNCPFSLREFKYLLLYSEYYGQEILCTIDGDISIQTNAQDNLWQVSIPIGDRLTI